MAKFMGQDRFIGVSRRIIPAHQAQHICILNRGKLRTAKPFYIKEVFIITVTVLQNVISNLPFPIKAQHASCITHTFCHSLVGKEDFQHFGSFSHGLGAHLLGTQYPHAAVKLHFLLIERLIGIHRHCLLGYISPCLVTDAACLNLHLNLWEDRILIAHRQPRHCGNPFGQADGRLPLVWIVWIEGIPGGITYNPAGKPAPAFFIPNPRFLCDLYLLPVHCYRKAGCGIRPNHLLVPIDFNIPGAG